MTPQQQEKLFKKVQKRFPGWSKRQCSGYVHGVVDGLKHNEQQQKFIENDNYCIGYEYGFYDAQGDIVFIRIMWRPDRRSEPRWWEQCEKAENSE